MTKLFKFNCFKCSEELEITEDHSGKFCKSCNTLNDVEVYSGELIHRTPCIIRLSGYSVVHYGDSISISLVTYRMKTLTLVNELMPLSYGCFTIRNSKTGKIVKGNYPSCKEFIWDHCDTENENEINDWILETAVYDTESSVLFLIS